ncbi:MAG: hypothetical protein Kow00121_45590 [Elainellaceae cyanobacterium]
MTSILPSLALSIQKNPLMLPSHARVTDAVQAMHRTQTSYVLVVDQQLTGMLTEQDIIRAIAESKTIDSLTVAELMSRNVVTIQESEINHLFDVLQQFRHHQIRYLPVLGSQKEIVGVITLASILQRLDLLKLHKSLETLQQTAQMQQAQLQYETAQKQQMAELLAKTEAQYRLSESKLNMILNSAIASITNLRVFPDCQTETIYMSAGCEVVFGYSAEEFLAEPMLWASRVPAEDLNTVIADSFTDVFAARDASFEYRFLHKDGSLRWVSCTLTSRRDSETDSWVVTTVAMDITERKQIEAALRQSERRLLKALQEKELFLREIHHRIKNNLQVVSSLLDLQAGRVQDAQLREILEASQNRINSMALVHEALHQSQTLNQVNFSQYVQKLADNLYRTYTDSDSSIEFRINITPNLFISLNQAAPCGLILNELMTNSIKHGFPEGRSGDIAVALELQAQDVLMLLVSHNGNPLPANFNLQTVSSMGLRLVSMLVEQLRGKLDLRQGDRTEFRIQFPFARG